MKKLILLGIVVVLGASPVSAAMLNVKVETDKTSYLVGETVNWKIYCWDNAAETQGIALLAINLHEDDHAVFTAAETEWYAGLVLQLKGTEFGALNHFALESPGVPDNDGKLADIDVRMPAISGVNDAGHDDGLPPLPLFAQGSFLLTDNAFVGTHTITPSINGAQYWDVPMPDQYAQSARFDEYNLMSAEYEVTVIPEPATLLLTAIGLGGLGVLRRRR